MPAQEFLKVFFVNVNDHGTAHGTCLCVMTVKKYINVCIVFPVLKEILIHLFPVF